MQSGISGKSHIESLACSLLTPFPASQELHDAFNELVSSSSQRGLLATIKNESLVPVSTLALSSDFKSDLNSLQSHLTPTAALYILLKLDDAASDGYVAVTYVPDAAPVRQKMLFASTRLTLVRELGVERFRETIFVTTAKELTPEGWEKHESHTKLEAPLTEEEEGLKGIKEAEASEGGGTGARKSHVSSGIAMNMDSAALQALEGLKSAQEGALVMIVSGSWARIALTFDRSANGFGRKSISRTRSSFSIPRHRMFSQHTLAPASLPLNPDTPSIAILARKAWFSCTAVRATARSRSVCCMLPAELVSSTLPSKMLACRLSRSWRPAVRMSGRKVCLRPNLRRRRWRRRDSQDRRDQAGDDVIYKKHKLNQKL